MKGSTPARPPGRVFYGWVIVGVMFVATATSMLLASLNYGLFIKPMGDDLGISRSLYGWGQTVRQVGSAVTSPTFGMLLDRFGGRFVVPITMAIGSLLMMGLGGISSGWQMIVLLALMGLVGMGGPQTLVTSVPVAKWFVRKRGSAMAWVFFGAPVGGVTSVLVTQALMEGWAGG